MRGEFLTLSYCLYTHLFTLQRPETYLEPKRISKIELYYENS